MTYHTVTLNGSDVPYIPGSLDFDSEYGSETAVSLSLIDVTGTIDYQALMGTATEVKDPEGATVFRGVLADTDWDLILGTDAVAWKLKFSDFNSLADRVCVFDYYDNAHYPLTSDIVKAIITDYLAQFGVTEGTIEDGSTVSEVTYNGQKASKSLEELAKRDGYLWRIDDDRKLHYRSQSSVSAPWNITAASGKWRSMSGSASLADYFNRVYQRGPSSGISDSRTESQVGDGVRREFKLTYRAHSDVSVKVNGAAKTIGIKGVSSGYDFYWGQGSDIITQDDAGTLLTAGDTLAVTYRGQVSLSVQLEDSSEIAARAASEGTSGVYEALFEDSSALFLDLTVQAAETRLRQSPFDKCDLTYTTDEPGLRAGMVQSIEVPQRGIDDTFLIVSVSASELETPDGRVRYKVKCVLGERADDWMDYYRRISDLTDYSIRDNETVQICQKLAATVSMSSVCSVSSAPAWVWGTDASDSSEFDGGDAWW